MINKLKRQVLILCCLSQVSLCFALPQVEDAGEILPSSDQGTANSGYLSSSGPITSPEVTQTLSKKESNINDDLLARLRSLEEQVQQLQGHVDELEHSLKQSQSESAQQFLMLNDKLGKLTTLSKSSSQTQTQTLTAPSKKEEKIDLSSSSVKSDAPLASPSQPLVKEKAQTEVSVDAQEKATYDAAYGLVSAKAYPDAIEAFEGYLMIYPHGKYVANANYWLGELNANQESYTKALKFLKIVVDQYPDSPKASDALLKLGVINKRLGNDEKAKQYFNQVIKDYPQSVAAKAAHDYLVI